MPHLEYPKMLHHKKHGHKTVKSKDEEDELVGSQAGWGSAADVEAEKQAEEDAKNAPIPQSGHGNTYAKSKPSATELGGAPLSLDPSDLDDVSARVVTDAADAEDEEETDDNTDAAERKRRSSGGKHKK